MLWHSIGESRRESINSDFTNVAKNVCGGPKNLLIARAIRCFEPAGAAVADSSQHLGQVTESLLRFVFPLLSNNCKLSSGAVGGETFVRR